MNKLLLITAFVTTVSAATMVGAKNYIRGDIGIGIPDSIHGAEYSRPKPGFVFDIGVGKIFTDKIRGDISYTRFNDFKAPCSSPGCVASQKFSSNVFLVNGYYDFFKFRNVKIYGTAGLGAAFTQNKNYNVSNGTSQLGRDATTFAWTLGLGLNYPVSQRVSFDLHYNYMNLGTAIKTRGVDLLPGRRAVNNGARTKGRFGAHIFGIGVQFTF